MSAAPPVPGRSPRLSSLTGMRFFAAFLVFLFHLSLLDAYSTSGEEHGPFAAAVKNGGWAGVTFFFILSGFVLAWSARDDDTTRAFWGRRVVKIVPNHVVTFFLALASYAYVSATWGRGIPNFLLLQAWIPRDDVFFSINNPSWSLSCELVFYLLFPALYRAVRRIRAERLWQWAGGTAAVIVLLPLLVQLLPAGETFGPHHANSPLYGHSITQMWLVYIFPPARVLDFLLGILMARIVLSGRWIGLGVLPALAVTVAAYALSLQVPFLFSLNAVVVVPFALLISAAAARDAQGRGTAVSGRVWVWLGEVSFAFYLVHQILLSVVQERFGYREAGSFAEAAVVAALIAAVSLLLAWLLYAGVERPAVRAWARRARAARMRHAAVAPVPASDGSERPVTVGTP
ncbi:MULTISPECIES: acyltransferase [unclassified Streptomyces]|uniref:acyltransferase family protein n=1 Tax=unclassified Streptomyces TaxID=2593676 RepID=UPI001F03CAF2|nr:MULTISPECIES: acyltransferase [unclassified Streptomyces]MCH0566233.1 acyltransferase [Streptomyces sp. MUM 2J]MCH0568400.1 acyltransferase [Streptomyces sp. MUM 136J]